MLRYRDMTDEQKAKKKERVRQYIRNHYEKHKERIRKHRTEHPEECMEYKRKYKEEHRVEIRKRNRERKAQDLNHNGVTKDHVRRQSLRYLLLKHAKLDGYEVHHCFGYEDYTKFIYIPKNIHLQIHQLLRDNKIPADTDHWTAIRDLVNSCDQYTYISV